MIKPVINKVLLFNSTNKHTPLFYDKDISNTKPPRKYYTTLIYANKKYQK